MSPTWVQTESKLSPKWAQAFCKNVYFAILKHFLDSLWTQNGEKCFVSSFWTHFGLFFLKIKKWVLFELMSSFWTHFGLILSSKMSSRGVQNELTQKMSSWAHFRVQNESSWGPKWAHELKKDSFWTHFSRARYSLILPNKY